MGSRLRVTGQTERSTSPPGQGLKIDPDEIFSLHPALPELNELLSELTQILYSRNGAGKIVIEKTPEGFTSPDRADAVCMCFAPLEASLDVWERLGAAP